MGRGGVGGHKVRCMGRVAAEIHISAIAAAAGPPHLGQGHAPHSLLDGGGLLARLTGDRDST